MFSVILDGALLLYSLLVKGGPKISPELVTTTKDLVTKLIATGKRNGELTPEQSAAYQARLDALALGWLNDAKETL